MKKLSGFTVHNTHIICLISSKESPMNLDNRPKKLWRISSISTLKELSGWMEVEYSIFWLDLCQIIKVVDDEKLIHLLGLE